MPALERPLDLVSALPCPLSERPPERVEAVPSPVSTPPPPGLPAPAGLPPPPALPCPPPRPWAETSVFIPSASTAASARLANAINFLAFMFFPSRFWFQQSSENMNEQRPFMLHMMIRSLKIAFRIFKGTKNFVALRQRRVAIRRVALIFKAQARIRSSGWQARIPY